MSRRLTVKDCGVKGCKRAAYRMGVCRAHKPLVPLDLSTRAAVEAARASHKVGQKYERLGAQAANRALREKSPGAV